jgi:hypothetical protein
MFQNNQDAAAVFSVNMHLLIGKIYKFYSLSIAGTSGTGTVMGLNLLIFSLLVKILDLDCERKTERIQAAKLARKLLIFGKTVLTKNLNTGTVHFSSLLLGISSSMGLRLRLLFQ